MCQHRQVRCNMVWAWQLVCVMGMVPSTVVMIDRTTAYTTLRLWHRLHELEGRTHDFGHLLAPDTDDRYQYVAAVYHKEYIRAIARCRREGLYRFRFDALASAPDDQVQCEQLISAMLDANYRPSLDVLRSTSRSGCSRASSCSRSRDAGRRAPRRCGLRCSRRARAAPAIGRERRARSSVEHARGVAGVHDDDARRRGCGFLVGRWRALPLRDCGSRASTLKKKIFFFFFERLHLSQQRLCVSQLFDKGWVLAIIALS